MLNRLRLRILCPRGSRPRGRGNARAPDPNGPKAPARGPQSQAEHPSTGWAPVRCRVRPSGTSGLRGGIPSLSTQGSNHGPLDTLAREMGGSPAGRRGGVSGALTRNNPAWTTADPATFGCRRTRSGRPRRRERPGVAGRRHGPAGGSGHRQKDGSRTIGALPFTAPSCAPVRTDPSGIFLGQISAKSSSRWAVTARARHAAPRCRRQPVSRRRRAAERTRPPAHASGTYLDLPGLCVPLGQDLDDLTLRAVSKLMYPARPHADHCFQHSGRRAPDTLPSVPDHRPGLRSRPPDSHVPTTAAAARHTVVDGSSRRLP